MGWTLGGVVRVRDLLIFSFAFVNLWVSSALFGALSDNCQQALAALANNPNRDQLSRYEAVSILHAEAPQPQDYIENYTPKTGIFITKRDAQGNATEGVIRELIDNDSSDVRVIGPFNKWGISGTDDYQLHPVSGTVTMKG